MVLITRSKEKEEQEAKIKADIAAYLASGGKIKKEPAYDEKGGCSFWDLGRVEVKK